MYQLPTFVYQSLPNNNSLRHTGQPSENGVSDRWGNVIQMEVTGREQSRVREGTGERLPMIGTAHR